MHPGLIIVSITCACVNPPNWVGLLKFADNRDLGRGYELSGVHPLETGVETLVGDHPIPDGTSMDEYKKMVGDGRLLRRRYVLKCHACGLRLPMRGDRLDRIAAMLFALPTGQAPFRGEDVPAVDIRQLERMLAKA
jgi:hypothetical protein